jgi:hypothetical protein
MQSNANKASYHLRSSLAIAELRALAKCDIARLMHKLGEALLEQDGAKTEAEETLSTAKRLRREIEKENYDDSDQNETAYDRLVCGNIR